jgi:formamidopyrimidine-DNA glycosylase
VPELPEVETTRRGIRAAVVGRTVRSFDLREPRLRWPVAPAIATEVVGRRVLEVERRAKYLLIRLERGTLIVHLGMSGSLRVMPADSPRLPHDHYDLVLDSGQCLRYNDPRRFGSLHWCLDDARRHFLLASLGPEPLGNAFDAAYLAARAKGRRVAVKRLLMDQRVVVGVGNIYASEALFRAGVRPRRAAGRLTRAEWGRVVDAVRSVLADAIRQGGTTLRDYVGADGTPGHFRQELYVYDRAGQPCRRCATPIRHLVQGHRSTYFCPRCQT